MKMFDADQRRPDFEGAARLIEEEARPDGVVVDGLVFRPGLLSPLDPHLSTPTG